MLPAEPVSPSAAKCEMNTESIEWMNVSELAFDIRNPRLPEFDLTGTTPEVDVIRILWEAMDVRELVMSIEASGFFPHEPLIVAHEGGKNVVIEGNRRLAAVKLLLHPDLAEEVSAEVPVLSEERKEALNRLPIIRETREGAWRYLGFKHVNGPAKWGSYAKSKYVAGIHKNYGVSLEEIGRQIGDTHKTVQRLYRGLMVIEQAERQKLFNREDRWRMHFSFSHLYTGIDYPGIGRFIGLRPATDESPEPVPPDKMEELRELCLWMYGSRKEEKPPLVERQNPDLRYLESVVANKEAIVALRAGETLRSAYEISRPSSGVFEENLTASRRNLEKARSKLSAGYDGSEKLLRIAGTVLTIAEDLYNEMERKHTPEKEKKRLTVDD